MSDIDREFLESPQRFDLSILLRHCETAVEEVEVTFDWVGDLSEEAIVIRAPVPTRTSICGHGITIGARTFRNTRTAASTFASYSAQRSTLSRLAHRFHPNRAKRQDGSVSIAHCRRLARSWTRLRPKKTAKRSVCCAEKSSYLWRRPSMIPAFTNRLTA